MFDLMPFERRTRNLSNFFDAFDKTFFSDFPASFSEIRTDILDKGDKFVLQAELPGFDKEDIRIDLNGDTLSISAEHKAESEEKKEDGLRPQRTPLRLLRAQLRRLRHRRRKNQRRVQKRRARTRASQKGARPAAGPPDRAQISPRGFLESPVRVRGRGISHPVQIFSRIRLFRREFNAIITQADQPKAISGRARRPQRPN